VFWVSVFEDEATFRRNTASFGYDFGGRLVFWEAPLAEPEAFFGTLLDAVAREHPEALVIDSVTEVLASGGGLDIIHNVLYRAVKQSGVDVFLTAEKDVASKVTYVADNVIELIYEVYPYGALREAVVRKIRGGKAGYSIPFIIREGRGIVFLAPEAPAKTAAEQLSTGTCLDEAVGGVYKGLLHAIVGPVGAGKTWLMLKAASALRERGRSAVYIAVSGAGAVYAERFGVDTVDVNLNVEAPRWSLQTATWCLSEAWRRCPRCMAPLCYIRCCGFCYRRPEAAGLWWCRLETYTTSTCCSTSL
jgi:KaiC/GvpD/RAD55 family RecA-like ATPase